MTDRLSDKQLRQFAEWMESDGHHIVGLGIQLQECAELIKDELDARMESTALPSEKIVKLVPEPPTEPDEPTPDTEKGR